MRIAVIIPALDEERSLPKVLAEVPRTLASEVVVVDNGSRDRTSEVAKAAGATVLSEPRAGYGQACLTGIAYLAGAPPDIVVFVDGDYSDRAARDDGARCAHPRREEPTSWWARAFWGGASGALWPLTPAGETGSPLE